ncbi:MAG: hypothetical protein K0R08_1971 [Solimicrobium sp.]|jgi:hypothetical protein|nr:hypothetical protein [Solimicrobium sp.]
MAIDIAPNQLHITENIMEKISKLVLFSLFLKILMVSSAWAADQLPPEAPPQMDNLSEEEPAVTKSRKEKVPQTIQTSQHGQQAEIRVTNEIGTYIVKPNQTIGTSLPGDAQSSSNNPVQWILKSWGGSKNTDPTAAPPTLEEDSHNKDNIESSRNPQ